MNKEIIEKAFVAGSNAEDLYYKGKIRFENGADNPVIKQQFNLFMKELEKENKATSNYTTYYEVTK